MKAIDMSKRISGYVNELATDLDDIEQNERYQKWLDLVGKFHRYSYYNTLSILMHRPDATYVRGFRQWLTLKRCVQKGEKGIPIFVPMFMKNRDDNGDEDGETTLRFKVAYVFDIEQTDGEELDLHPDLPDTDAHAQEYEAIIEYSQERGVILNDAAIIRTDGNTDGKEINLRQGLSIDAKAKVAIHELAHIELEHTSKDDETAKQTRELEAESISHVVGKLLGLPVNGTEIYLASYDITGAMLKSAMDRISKTVKTLYDAIAEHV